MEISKRGKGKLGGGGRGIRTKVFREFDAEIPSRMCICMGAFAEGRGQLLLAIKESAACRMFAFFITSQAA